MTAKRECATCANAVRRFRRSRPQFWCKAYAMPAGIPGGCIDHRAKPTVASVLGFYKRLASK